MRLHLFFGIVLMAIPCAAFQSRTLVIPRAAATRSLYQKVGKANRPQALTKEVAIWVGTSVLGGMVGTPAVVSSVKGWYAQTKKPRWCPPDGIFAPVWTLLYASMGFAALTIKREVGFNSPAIKLSLAHYILNLTWAPVFFGLGPRWSNAISTGAFINIGLVLSLAAIIFEYSRINALAAGLLLPYFAWLAFATALNFEIWRLNPKAP
mmetsp:Transcript_63490/g.143199  ORF Transcript_63490/g.143199 Transcript_63490/m.143199 type:complete len:208 (+) Transcript_63490:72-695(+)